MKFACVPLPAPGAPSSISLIFIAPDDNRTMHRKKRLQKTPARHPAVGKTLFYEI
jgi:hypothetical protein